LVPEGPPLMTDLFKTLSAGFSRFALAWLLPTVATLSVFVVFVYPEVSGSAAMTPVRRIIEQGALQAGLVFAFSAMILAAVFSLTALPWVRLMEGYGWPRPARNRWVARQMRRHMLLVRRLNRTSRRYPDKRGQLLEAIGLYPKDRRDFLPTRLGNAYRSIETYGADAFNLDTQAFNYELFSVASPRLLQDFDEAYVSVDFFLGFVGQLSALSAVSLAVAVGTGSPTCLVVALASLALARLAYLAAIKNMIDLGYATQALLHTGRAPLAKALGYALPSTMTEERGLWRAWMLTVQERESRNLERMDAHRLPPGPAD
jgi:hypothetical protein